MKRDIALDVLRGIMLVVMAADHFGEPVFQHLYEIAGYVSAAEGFVFLSGMLVAIVYGRYCAAGGYVLEKRIWNRAGTIYLYHLIVLLAVFVFTVATAMSDAYWKSFATEMQVEPVRALLSGLLMLYQPPMLDVLPLYVVLMLFAPFALRLMFQYQGVGLAMVLAVSAGLWLAAQYAWGDVLLGLLPDGSLIRLGAFHVLAWQLLFVLGMVLGFMRFSGIAPRVHAGWWLISVGVVIYLYLLRHGQVRNEWLALHHHIAREYMAWLRLLNFLAFVYMVAGFIALHRRYQVFALLALPGRWLAFLGQHSLQVFAYHLVVLYCYIPFRWGEWAFTDGQKWFVLAVFLASLTLPALAHQHYLQRKKAKSKPKSTPDFNSALA